MSYAGVLTAGLRRIGHSANCRWQRVLDFFRAQWTRLYVSLQGRMPLRNRRHSLPGTLVVSLTSYPARFGALTLTLRGLLRQTITPDHLILWISPSDFCLLPKSVIDLQSRGLEIRVTEDIKSYKKIIPALDQFADSFIATADDDTYYWPTWLEELVEGAEPSTLTVTCHRAHQITTVPQGYRPYREWVFDTPWRGKAAGLFPTGAGGILYPPGALDHRPEDRESIQRLCPQADDIWLYWMGRRNGAIYKTVGRHRELVAWAGSQSQALWRTNIVEHHNDRQIRDMAAKYGYPAVG